MEARDRFAILAAAALVAAAGVCAQQSEHVEWKVVDGGSSGKVSKPQYWVKLEKESTVVTIFAGRKPTAGFSVVVTGADRVQGVCTIRYRVGAPEPRAMVAQVVTYPAVTVRVAAACQEVRVDPPLPRGITE